MPRNSSTGGEEALAGGELKLKLKLEALAKTEAGRLTAAGCPAEAGTLVAEPEGWPSTAALDRELAEAGLVVTAATKGVLLLIVKALVSTSSTADSPNRHRYTAKDGRAGCTGHGGALLTRA